MNLTILHGNCGRMSELRYIGDKNTAFVEFSIATTERYKDQRTTTWHNCKAFGRRAEVIAQYFGKGSEMLIIGRLNLEQWTDKDGGKRSKMVVTISSFEFIGGKRSENKQSGAAQDDAPQSPAEGLVDDAPASNDGPPADDAPPPEDEDALPF